MNGTHAGIDSDVDKLRDEIVRYCDPTRIYLFGSRARGDAKSDSDIDIIVVWDAKPKLTPGSRQLMIRRNISTFIHGIDLLVYTSEELDRALGDPLSFASQALREAKVIYG